MKNHLLALLVILSPTAFAEEAKPTCFDSAPGEEGIRPDTPEKVRLVKVTISDLGDTGYVATEYIEAANLQAVFYLKEGEKYCTAGDLGPLTDFHTDRNRNTNSFYDLIVNSKSGRAKFTRGFSFKDTRYQLSWCTVSESGSKARRCTKNEEARATQ